MLVLFMERQESSLLSLSSLALYLCSSPPGAYADPDLFFSLVELLAESLASTPRWRPDGTFFFG